MKRLSLLPDDDELDFEKVGERPPPDVNQNVILVFSIKEAVYKAFFPIVRKVWGFMEVEVEIDLMVVFTGRGLRLVRRRTQRPETPIQRR